MPRPSEIWPRCTRAASVLFRGTDGSEETQADARLHAEFVKDTGNIEDRDVTIEIQEGLASGANSHFTYGRFEKAIVHFHKSMAEMLAKVS